tara:strand:- start:32 stop:553 length:522 start_codon:yes stop_codon:yes gene_type:complete
MATYKFPKGTVDFVKTVEVDQAFITNSYVEAEMLQPANTIIQEIKLVVTEGPVVAIAAASDLGYKVGTDTSTAIADGADDICEDADGIIDAADATDSLSTGFVQSIFRCVTAPAATIAAQDTAAPAAAVSQDANVGYTASDRTLFMNTLATTDAAVVVGSGGKVRWVVTFTFV